MSKAIWMGAAALLLTVVGPATAGTGGDDEQGSGVEAISGRWAHQDAACNGDASRQMSISADGDTLTVTLGESSAEEEIDSDRGGVVLTHSEEGRFRYRVVDGALTIADLDLDLVERLTPCGSYEEDAAAPDDEDDAGDEDADTDDSNPGDDPDASKD